MRIRLKLYSRFSLEKLLLFFAIFSISSFALLEHMSIPIPVFSAVKWPLVYLGGLCVLTQLNMVIKTFMKKKYFYIWLAVLGLCGVLLLGAQYNSNPDLGNPPMNNTLRTVFYLLEMMVLMVWVSEKGYVQYLIKFLFRYVLILVLITDIFLFTGILQFYSGRYEAYLIGSKFTVSYMHMNLMTLWVIQQNKIIHVKQFSRLGLCLGAIFLFAVSIRVECMTGLIGCLLLFICLFVVDSPKSKKRLGRLNSPAVLSSALGLNLIFPFVSELVLSIPLVQYFVVDVLGRNDTLTGRTNIFNLFSEKMSGHWLFGYGMGNQNVAAMELFGYSNAQNSTLQWVLQGGIVTLLALVLLMNLVIQNQSRSQNRVQMMPLIVLIYVYIILGMVETTFSMSFLLWLGLIFAVANEKSKTT